MAIEQDATGGRYPTAAVVAGAAAGCYLATLVVVAVFALAFGAVDAAPEPGENATGAARFFVIAGCLAAAFLVALLSAWYAGAAGRGRRSVWDIVALGGGVVAAAVLLLLAVTLALVIRQNPQLVRMIGTVGQIATDLRLAALARALPPDLAARVDAGGATAPVPDSAFAALATLMWVLGRAVALLSGFAAVLLVALCSLALLDRGSELLPRGLLLAGVSTLPFGLPHLLVLFGGAPFALTLPALALTGAWLAALTVALLRAAEREQREAQSPAPA